MNQVSKNGSHVVPPPLSAGEFVTGKSHVYCDPEDTVCRAVMKMRNKHTYAALVVRNDRLMGFLTGHDILVRAASWHIEKISTLPHLAEAFNILKVSDVMISNPMTLAALTPMDEAFNIMKENGFRHIPVLEGEKPIGILNIVHAAQYMEEKARLDSKEKDVVISYVMHHENYGGVSQD